MARNDRTLRGRVAVVGIGETEYFRHGGSPDAEFKLALKAIHCGLPVVRVGRGNPEGFADPHEYFIAGSNLTATKARMLLMACLLKFGSLPPAKNPDDPTSAELTATRAAVAVYQGIFDTH